MARSDDLATLFGGSPDDADMRYGQGVIRAWNPATFENIIEWRGTLLTNLPVWSGADALTYQVGDVVSLRGTGAGASTWAIDGRLIMPGPGAGARTVDWMTTALASELAAAVFAQRMFTSSIAGQGTRSAATFGDLDDRVGPVVNATIGQSGKALVMVSATITTGGGIYTGGLMGFQISGATSRAPSVADSLEGSMSAESFSQSATRVTLVTGLNPGAHTFTAKYRSVAAGQPFTAENRNLVVIAL